jgi:hypothetical protein
LSVSKQRVAPFPVLGNGDDFPDQSFHAKDIEIALEGGRYTISCGFECVLEGRAAFVLELDCPAVPGSRSPFATNEESISFQIDEQDVDNYITLAAYVVATEEIRGYSPKGMHPDYEGADLLVAKNEIVAVDPKGKRTFSLRGGLKSLIQVKRAHSPKQGIVTHVDTHDAFVVVLPQKDYDTWVRVKEKDPPLAEVLAMGFVLPALADAIHRLGSDDPPETSWSSALRTACEKARVVPEKCLPHEAAQTILDKPFARACKTASESIQGEEE